MKFYVFKKDETLVAYFIPFLVNINSLDLYKFILHILDVLIFIKNPIQIFINFYD